MRTFKLNKINPLLLTAITLMLQGCAGTATYRTDEGVVWATTYHITYKADRDLADSIRAVMQRVEMSLSPFQPRSVISAVNSGNPAKADSLIARVFVTSQEINRLSGGMFDPTVGPLIELWGFGTRKGVEGEPPDSLLASALERVGIGECGITPGGEIVKKHPQTMFNFSAITKGLGCDEVGRMLRRNGVTDYMVEIGGEIALSGLNRHGGPWRIMIDAPVEDASGTHVGLTTVSLTDCGIATSGNYRNFRDTSSGRVGHTISPRSGRPVSGGILSATVIAPDCMRADALATACMAMHPDSALRMLRQLPDTEGLLVLPPPPRADTTSDTPADTTLRLLSTPGFPPLTK